MSRNQSATRTQHTRKARLIAVLSWPAVRRVALAAPVAAGLALAAVVIPAGTASAIQCTPLTCGGGGGTHYATATALSSSANPSVIGQPVTYTATVSPAPPGGTVQFYDNGFTGTLIAGCGAVPVSAAGTATCTTTPDPGSHMMAAGYQPFKDSSGAWWEGSSAFMTQLAGELTAGQSLSAGQSIHSPNGQYTLTMQTDGNLCEYGPGGNALWCSGTYGTGSTDHVSMQTDGNLVIYTSAGTALWDSGTGGRAASGYALDLQNDANLVIYYPASYIPDGLVWSRSSTLTDQLPATLTAGQSITSPSGQYILTMQTDGNLVEYGPTWTTASGLEPVWASGTSGTGSSDHVTMQADGDLVIYNSAGQVLWTSGTGGHHGSAYTLDLQNDGNLVIYGPGPLWADNA